jgi:hypothetical protein
MIPEVPSPITSTAVPLLDGRELAFAEAPTFLEISGAQGWQPGGAELDS